ncbi:MAG: SH3 domain-containing protein [Roseiflexus sp.]
MWNIRYIIGVSALLLALTGCAGVPLPGIGGAPTTVEQPTLPSTTETPTADATPVAGQPSPETTPTADATPVAGQPSPTVIEPVAVDIATSTPSPTATDLTPTATTGPTEEPLYLQPTPIPGLPTAAPPTATPTPSPTPTATPVSSPTPDTEASPSPTPTYPPVPIVSSLRGTVTTPGNVHADPNVRASSIDRVNQGEEVQLLGRSDNGRWYLVLTIRGVAGWVSAVLLSVPPDTAALVPVNPDIVLPTPPGSTP